MPLTQHGVKLVYCNAHARRKFEPIAKGAKAEGLAMHAMKTYRKLYKSERNIKNEKKEQQL